MTRKNKWTYKLLMGEGETLGWRQDNGNKSNQESKFDFLATGNGLVKIDRVVPAEGEN